ncbi:MAG: FAD-dependent oxidoreductase [Armatimonadota bacterium]|nr:FAD-dependent oxidoreductase [Armatimonadota bacterium]MDR7440164.1 FAD-dependent oxidoreductase [Armatimonadota bacterium]MDR7563830.1 FAD-dependent oxidoreductase [Armatimonadota bacterium]MDR7567216.1 FAD-dependent oxidoreductase [Armatimonadota bacterium]MDR7603050.1 FAD-dependent oxidoreductase [Armatimonadota bacterium]
MDRPDVVVVGGGAVGLCCACALARGGLRVLLVERKHPGAGASWGNAGLVAPSRSLPLAEPGAVRRGLRWMLDPASPLYVPLRPDRALWTWLWRFRRSCTDFHVRRAVPLLVRLQRRSLELYEQLVAEGLDFGWHRAGSLSAFLDEWEYWAFLHEVDLLRREGIAAEMLDGEAAQGREPLLRPEVAGAVYFPHDAHLDPAALVQALAQRAVRLGAEVRPGCDARLQRRGRTVVVQVEGQEMRPAAVVVAAGAWSGPLLRPVGVRLPVLPAKGYSVTLASRLLPRSPLMLSEARVAVTPLPNREGSPQVRLAGTLELGVWGDIVNPRRVAAIREAASRYLRLDPEGGEVWAGLRPCTPDGLPVVGRPRGLANVVVATGHGTLGISLAPVTGELVAQLVTGEEREDLEPLSPDRFG